MKEEEESPDFVVKAMRADSASAQPPDATQGWLDLAGRLGLGREETRPAVTHARRPRSTGTRRWNGGVRRQGSHINVVLGLVAAALAITITVHPWNRRARQESVPPAREYATRRGQIAELSLSDGTQVRLAPGSRLTVFGTFGESNREVSLSGEAVFTVVHRADQPFIVHARNATAVDIGTVFDVREYPQDSSVRVAVREGAVALNSVVLNAGDVAHVSASGETGTVRHHADVAVLFAWTRGVLVFENTPLREVVAQLSRWYDVDFVLSDPILGRIPLTVKVHSDDAVETVLRAISLATRTRVTRKGRVITIAPGAHVEAPELPQPHELAHAGQ